VERGQVREVANQRIELDEVSEGYAISGLYDLIAKVMMPTYDALGEAIPDKVHTMHGIRETETLDAYGL